MKRCLLLLILSLIGLFILGPVRGFGISTGHSRSLTFPSCIHSDDSTSRAWLLRRNFSVLAERIPAYNNEIDVSVTNFSVSELIKGIAISNGLSIAINFDKRKGDYLQYSENTCMRCSGFHLQRERHRGDIFRGYSLID